MTQRHGRMVGVLGACVLLGFLVPRAARADPHAVFLTDNAFRQVFYAALAALNQADYVEPPTQPTPPATPPKDFQEFNYAQLDADEVRLPRLRVRAVTPDDGDLYYRLRLLELDRAIRIRHELDQIACAYYSYAEPAQFEKENCAATLGT